jgi:hypothetical protein
MFALEEMARQRRDRVLAGAGRRGRELEARA